MLLKIEIQRKSFRVLELKPSFKKNLVKESQIQFFESKLYSKQFGFSESFEIAMVDVKSKEKVEKEDEYLVIKLKSPFRILRAIFTMILEVIWNLGPSSWLNSQIERRVQEKLEAELKKNMREERNKSETESIPNSKSPEVVEESKPTPENLILCKYNLPPQNASQIKSRSITESCKIQTNPKDNLKLNPSFETPKFEVPFSEYSKHSFSTVEFAGLEHTTDWIANEIIYPTTNSNYLAPLGIFPPLGFIVNTVNKSRGDCDFLQLGYAFASALSNLKIVKQIRVFQRKSSDIYCKDPEKALKLIKEMFATAMAFEGSSVILIEDIQTMFYCPDFDVYLEAEMAVLHDEISKLTPGKIFVVVGTDNPSKIPPEFTTRNMLPSYVGLSSSRVDTFVRMNLLTNGTEQWPIQPDRLIFTNVIAATFDFSPKKMKDLCVLVMKEAVIRKREELSKSSDCCKHCLMSNKTIDADFIADISPTWKDWEKIIALIRGPLKIIEPDTDLHSPHQFNPLGFEGVGGLDDEIQCLKETVLFPMEHRDQLEKWGVNPVRGIIFHGPPGTGKTLLARALAAELGKKGDKRFSFFYQKSSDCFNMYVGETERKLRELFSKAEAMKPSIIFFDEFDGLCVNRNDDYTSKFHNSVTTTLLGLMDSVMRGDVVIIAATNRLEALDPAIRRPGRFDQSIAFHLPKKQARKAILEIHTQGWTEESKKENDLEYLSERTEGYSGADLEQLCRSAFMISLKRFFPFMQKNREEKQKEGLKPDFDPLRVETKDWDSALKSVRKSTCQDALGLHETVGSFICPYATVMLKSRVTEIIAKIGNYQNSASPAFNHFLIYGNEFSTIENFLMPCLLKELENCVPFTMTNALSSVTLASIIRQIRSVGDGKSSLLYLPAVDRQNGAHRQTPVISDEYFAAHLASLRGERLLIIGTSQSSPDGLSAYCNYPFKWSATRSYKMQKFSGAEYREHLFEKLLEKSPKLIKQAEADVDLKELSHVLNLRGEIEQEIKYGPSVDEQEMSSKIASVLKEFRRQESNVHDPRTRFSHFYT